MKNDALELLVTVAALLLGFMLSKQIARGLSAVGVPISKADIERVRL